jgi:hypothetical protein
LAFEDGVRLDRYAFGIDIKRRRQFEQPRAARAAGVTDEMPVYRLRSSYVSLLLWEGAR